MTGVASPLPPASRRGAYPMAKNRTINIVKILFFIFGASFLSILPHISLFKRHRVTDD
jgi:hypothetical protein